MCMKHGIGADLTFIPDDIPSYAWFFGEDQGRYVIAVNKDNAGALINAAQQLSIPVVEIGVTGGNELRFGGLDIGVEEMRDVNEGVIGELF